MKGAANVEVAWGGQGAGRNTSRGWWTTSSWEESHSGSNVHQDAALMPAPRLTELPLLLDIAVLGQEFFIGSAGTKDLDVCLELCIGE